MRRTQCEQCGNTFPVNETLRVAGRVLCDACCDAVLAERQVPQSDLERQFDPTVCAHCRTDHGTTELSKLAGVPTCQTCETFFRNRPYPAWIKLALVAVIVLVGVSLVWNLRFFGAYRDSRRAFACWFQGDLAGGSALMASSASQVPESEDLRVMATYMEGVVLMVQDKCAEALAKFRQCKDKMPPEYEVDIYTLHALAGAAFQDHDYDAFLNAAQTLAHQQPDDHYNHASVASAMACKYVETGDEAYHQQSLACLEEARNLAQGDPSFAEYENRILYRLEAREIIETEEFYRRFPDGWSPEKED